MKIVKSLFSIVGLVGLVASFASCSPDWGSTDPEAGNQTYATRQAVASYNFEYAGKKQFSDLNMTHNLAEVVKDDSLGSNVLHLNDSGCVRIVNPFTTVKLQNGAAVAFWVKLDSTDTTRPLFSFGSEDENAPRFTFGVNGQLTYSKPGQLESLNLDENNPKAFKTGILSAGKWHFVALQVAKSGYQLYVDGNKSLSGHESDATAATNFKYETLLKFINTAPYLYIGTEKIGDVHAGAYFDDVALIGNQMDAKDWNKSASGSGGGSEAFKYVLGDPVLEVGTSDCSAEWWKHFSNYYRMPSGSAMRFRFVNHTSGANNWNNWNLCLSTDADRGGDSYKEYFVIRSDKYGWGESYNGDNFNNEGYPTDDAGWAEFRKEMEGATVDVTIARSGSTVNVTAVATGKSGKVYTERFSAKCGDGSQVVRAFFIVDGSYLVFDKTACVVESAVTLKTTTIGAADNSSEWWKEFSDYFQIPAGKALHLGFTNHTSGNNNWNNWNLCVSTKADRGTADYKEYFVIRSDKYGWGESYKGDNFSTEGYPTDDSGWAEYRKDMEGAKVGMTISRVGAEVTVKAVATCTNGKVYVESFHATCGDGKQEVNAFLIVDGSHLEMDTQQCYVMAPLYN